MNATTIRRRRVISVLSLLVPASLIGLGMWSAGVNPGQSALPDDDAVATRALSNEPQPRQSGQPSAVPTKAAEVTEQSIALFATAPGRNRGEGSAILGNSADSAKMYSAGAMLANRMRIVEIHPAFVVLERNGRQQRLHLQGAGPAGATTAVAAAEIAPLASVEPRPAPQPLRDTLSEVVRSMPLYADDELVGLELHAGVHEQAFTQLGLQEGDVLVEIDDAPMKEARAATQQLRSIIQGAALTVSIRRGGSLMTLTLDGAAVAAFAGEKLSPPG